MNSKAEARRRAVLEALARAMEPLIAARAKERQKEHGGTAPGRGKTLSQKSVKVIDTKKEAASRAKERQESGKGADGSGGRGKRKNLCQKSDKGFDTKKEAAARAEASYEANVGRPKKSCQKSDKISRVDTKREAADSGQGEGEAGGTRASRCGRWTR